MRGSTCLPKFDSHAQLLTTSVYSISTISFYSEPNLLLISKKDEYIYIYSNLAPLTAILKTMLCTVSIILTVKSKRTHYRKRRRVNTP